jgi:hypothetical protein
MAFTIEDIEVNANNIYNAISYNYPNTFKGVEDENSPLYERLFLFGIRVSTCDTSIPDDILGAMRFMPNRFLSGGNWQIIVTDGTTDPSPNYLVPGKYYDAQARAKGGTSWVKEGQFPYRYSGLLDKYPCFCPVTYKENGITKGIPVYRWNPKFVGEKFDISKAKLSESTDCCIHRHWNSQRLINDSAGCQVLKNNALLWQLRDWAFANNKHKTYPKTFVYTLLTKEQFLQGATASLNEVSTGYNTFGNWWNHLF